MNPTLTINDAQSVIPNSHSKSLVFIDSGLDDYQTLVDGALPGAEIIILDKNGNGVEQITAKLQTIAAAGGTVDQVHIFSHGSSGSLQLGSATLNSDNLPEYESQLQGWRNALSDQADIVLYGCDVAAGSGIDFVDRLSELTGADIAASTDLTGHGGNWNLEWAKGDIEAPLALTPEAMADYRGTLKTITVTNNNDSGAGSLRNAIASAAAGDTIQFASSLARKTITLTSGELVIKKNLTIEAGNAGQLTISGNNTSRVILTEGSTNVTLKNLIIANGRVSGTAESSPATSAGGGIQTGGRSTLTLENCQVNNNVAGFGGGLYTGHRSKTTVINSKFSGNDGSLAPDGERGGGAIATKSGSTLTIRDSEFTNNKGKFGGAVNNLLGSMTIENSKFTGNVAIKQGGAVYVDGANDSAPKGLPGPVGGNIIIRNSLFEGNTAGEGGGAYLFGYPPDKMLLENSYFINNKAVAKGALGGGLYQANADLTVKNSFFGNNTAQEHGGGLWADLRGDVNISNSTFSGNRAGIVGGAMLLARRDSFSTNIVNSTFANNIAEGYSGAIGVFKDPVKSPITVKNSIFDRNRANNPDKTRQHTGWELTNGGNNIQFPAKLTSGARDSNATANITIADPLLGPVEYKNGMFVMLPRPGSPANRLRSGATALVPSRALLPGDNGSAGGSGESFAEVTLAPAEPPMKSEIPMDTEDPTEREAPIETKPPMKSEIPMDTEDPTESEIPMDTEDPTESETAIETEPPTESETAIETEPPTESETAIETEPATKSETPPLIEPATKSETAIETEPATKSETPIETEPATKSETPIETEPATESETAIETEPPTESETAIETETPRETETAPLIETPRETETAPLIETPRETETTPLIETPRETETTPLIETSRETETTPLIETPRETKPVAPIQPPPTPPETSTETPASDDCLLEDLNRPDLASILLLSNPGQETLNGGNDADFIMGRGINESINGLAGNDILFGMGGDDNIDGGADNDSIFGNEGSDFIGGDAGNDTIYGGKDNDAVFGGDGDDFLKGDMGNDIVAGGDGNDSIFGGKDDDILLGEDGEDYILGNLGNDTINAGNGNDIAFGNEGADLIFGLFGDDTLDGGQDNDSLDGGEGNDLLLGGDGNDVLCGDTDNDTLYGGNGNDILSGGAGDDFLSGDVGDDTLTGGSGSDLFLLNPSFGSDIITDFRKGEDLIGLTSGLSFNQLSISSSNNETLITVTDTNQLLAKLNGVKPGILTASDFTQLTI
jgi:hypothetical protein